MRLLEHQLLRGIESNRLLNSAQLARKYQIGAREVRRLLGDLGLLRRTFNGWELTREGERLGGVAIDSASTDSVAAISPGRKICSKTKSSSRNLSICSVRIRRSEPHEADLLDAISEYDARDGHRFHSRNEWLVCDWLYFAGIAHACHYRLPMAQEHCADFWLPAAHVYIEVGGDEKDAAEISSAMQRIELYRKHQWPFVEVRAEHFEHLDDYLTRALREFGVSIL